jgi:hypothetical protein
MTSLFLRKSGKTRIGTDFDDVTVQLVWNKGRMAPSRDPALWRLDCCNALIYRWSYGDTVPNGNGWEIDHEQPVARGGSDSLNNLQPLQWQNNRHKSDAWPQWSCLVSLQN